MAILAKILRVCIIMKLFMYFIIITKNVLDIPFSFFYVQSFKYFIYTFIYLYIYYTFIYIYIYIYFIHIV